MHISSICEVVGHDPAFERVPTEDAGELMRSACRLCGAIFTLDVAVRSACAIAAVRRWDRKRRNDSLHAHVEAR